jgi:outer membrane lipoprotein
MRKDALAVLIMAASLTMALSGCVSPISLQVRQEAAKDLSFKEVLSNAGAYAGKVVIWQGVIVKTALNENRSDLYVSETPSEFSGRPRGAEYSEGEFIARTYQILDLKTYTPGRKVTVAGEITGQQLGTYQGSPYAFPVIRVKELHLWEETAPLRL